MSDDYGAGQQSAEKSRPTDGQKREAEHEAVSADVETVKDHLRKNRTTEREAADLRDAATRSLADHYAAKSLRRD